MQKTSDLYQQLLQTDYSVDTRLAIGEPGVLITKRGEAITFGGVAILTGATGADGGYDETLLMSMETDNRLFSEDTPEVGGCISSQIDIEMIKPYADLPQRARLVPYVRLTDGVRYSEWIQKGVFYIDTRRPSAATGSLLLEAGAAGNSPEEAALAGRLFAETMVEVLQAKSK